MEVLSHTRQIDYYIDSVLLEVRGRTNPRQHEQVRRLNRATRHDDFGVTGANGLITIGGSGSAIYGTIIQAPTVGNGFLGVSLHAK